MAERESSLREQCPQCASRQVYRWGKSDGTQRFRCRRCGRTFQLAPPAKADAAPAPIRSLQNGSTAASGDSGVATPVAVDFLEWARTTSAAKQGGAMRKRLEGLFGARPTDKSTN
jgi:hypothetical protein